MKLLFIGDVYARIGRDMLFEYSEKGFFGADFVVANIENAAHGKGVTKAVFDELQKTGVDAFTTGNHIWSCKDAVNVLKFNDNIVRPYNFEGDAPGEGIMTVKAKNGVKVGIINLIGRVGLDFPPSSNPFLAADRAVEKLADRCDVMFVDFHAEATSEKMAMGYYLDGRVSAVCGTHTHIQTADEQILPKGTGYITDCGMTGPAVSVLGVDKNTIVDYFVTGMPHRFEPAEGKGQISAVMFDIDEKTKKTVSVERYLIRK